MTFPNLPYASLLLLLLLSLFPARAAGEDTRGFRSPAIRWILEPETRIPQQIPDGLTVVMRLGRRRIPQEVRGKNGHFLRRDEVHKVLANNRSPRDTRLAAVHDLATLPDRQKVEALVTGLVDPSPVVRSRAALELGLIGDDRAVKALIDMLGYSHGARKEVAAWALARLTGETTLGRSLRRWREWYANR